MNFCKQCGKEIAKGKKFCNSSCAAKYNNAHRVRKPWTEEQKQKVRKFKEVCDEKKQSGERVTKKQEPKRCKYCGKELTKNSLSLCTECRQYSSRLPVYLRAGLIEGPLQERNKQLQEIVYQMYIVEKVGVLEIWNRLGMSYRTVQKLLLERGSRVRTLSESLQVALERGRISLRNSYRFRSGYHNTWQGIRVFYRSSYELEYAKFLDMEKIPYRVEDVRIRYWDSIGARERVAVPDFHIICSGELIEIKSLYTYDEQNMKDKFKAYREAGYRPRLILEGKEIDLQY